MMKLTRQGWKSLSGLCRMCSAAAAVLVLATGCGTDGSSGTAPATAGATWSITAAGGTFQTNDGRVTLIVPANAVAAPVTVTPRVSASPGAGPAGYTIADGTFVLFNSVTFTQPVTLRFRIPASVADADVPFVRVFRKPDGSTTWQALARTLDIANRTIEVQTSQFSGFAVFTPGPNDWDIDQAGGEFTGAGHRIGLTVAQNAVNSLYRVRYTPIAQTDMGDLPAGWRYVQNSAFDFVWSDPTTQFDPAATYRIRFAGLNIPCDPSLVAIFTRTDFGPTHQWNQNGTTGLNAAGDEATVLVNRLQQHALFCPEQALPVHTVTRERTGLDSVTITVSRVDAGVFVPVISQSYDFRANTLPDLYDTYVIVSGVQVSAETLRVATLSQNSLADTIALVDLNLQGNQIDTVASLSGSSSPTFEYAPPGISQDGTTIAARVVYFDGSGNTTRRTVRVYSRQTRALLSETDIPTTDRSDIEAVGNNGVVLLSDRRVNNVTPTVTVVRNGSAALQFSGTIPRLDPGATKAYVVNNGQVEEHDLSNNQTRPIPINPVDFSIILQTSTILEMRYYRPVSGGCELVRRELSTNQETVLIPVTPCPSQTGTSGTVTYMLR